MRWIFLALALLTSGGNFAQEIENLVNAEAALLQHDTTRALILFENVLKANPDSYISALRLSEINYQRQIFNESVQYANIGEDILFRNLDSLDRKPVLTYEDSMRQQTFRADWAELKELKGKIRVQQRRYADALAEFNEALTYSRNPASVYQNIGVAHIQQGNKQEAIEAFQEAITANPGNTAAMMNLGNLYFNEKEYVSSSFFYIRALEIDPGILDAYNNLGSISTTQGDFEAAYTYYSEYLSLESSEEIYFKRAVILAELLKWESSIDDWDEVLKINPENPEALRNRGLCYFQLQDFSSAVEDFSAAITLKPEPYTYVNRGYCLYLLDQPKEALEDIEKGLAELPEYKLGYYFRGLVYKRLRKKKAACKDLERAMELGLTEVEINQDFLASCL